MMPNTSERTSKTSIISVDPTVASHITGSTKSTSQASHARTESTPARANSTPLVAASKSHSRTNSAPNRDVQKRSNSLRRAKNSTEVLKLRSINAAKNARQADTSGVKRGRNFTVSNVGTGGLLHLSPSPNQQPFSAPLTAPSPYPWTRSTTVSMLPAAHEMTLPMQPAQSRTRSVSPKRLLSRAVPSKSSREPPHLYNRSQSFSTVDESRRSISAALQPRTLKIVINRPDVVHSSDEEEAVPSLEIPIPHYKLGTPRFSAHGTPFIRASSYNRGSDIGSTSRPSTAEGIGGASIANPKSSSKLQYYDAATEHEMPMPNHSRVNKSNERQPVSTEIYDNLLEVYDHPSVVRYASSKRDIAAATKVRIIAQISSESFMDYDLVSDFFLTFRTYMTTFEVMDYLLTRLKWSIGRLSDDGRIIRIRTFAALRHWILNYFAEDFVVNRQLRLRFCQEVNQLYEDVRQRAPAVGRVSDLKILQDLKRCWNGRCALYWDAEEFNMDADQEDPLLPGGVLGSRNPAFADISEATAALRLDLHGLSQALPSPLASVSSRTTKRTNHIRLPSSDYAKKPLSVGSERSLQATSCSLPRRPSRSPDKDDTTSRRGPQPVSVLSRRDNAPSNLKVQVHSRTDSREHRSDHAGTTDDFDPETPVEALMNAGHYVDPHAGSMIRGFVYGPVEPFVQLPVDPPLSPSVRFSAEQQTSSSLRIPPSPHSATHGSQAPAVKHIMGSIRRALSGKQDSNEITLITVSAPQASVSQKGWRAPIPINLARSNDDMKRKAAGVPVKTQMRIDLLCAAAVQSFQTVVPEFQSMPAGFLDQGTPRFLQRAPVSPSLSLPDEMDQQKTLSARHPSHTTARSGSILIVDDTAVAMPVMSGALPESYVYTGARSASEASSPDRYIDAHQAQLETPVVSNEYPVDRSQQQGYPEHESGSATSKGLTLPLDDSFNRSGTPSAITILKLGSSTDLHDQREERIGHANSTRSTSPPAMSEATSTSESPISRAPAHGLRRRPGGDLRKNQNVHDLEPVMHHESLDSTLQSSSNAGSLLVMSQPATTNDIPEQMRETAKVSMIDTHSSQHLRPSFEAVVAGFSAIPDEDDGGLEATLLKLEGRYDGQSPTLSNSSMSPKTRSVAASSEQPLSASTNLTDHEPVMLRSYQDSTLGQVSDVSFFHDENVDPQQQKSPSQCFAHRSVVFGLPTESIAGSESEDSEISLPILQTGTAIGQAITTDSLNARTTAIDEFDGARSSSDILQVRHAEAPDFSRPNTAHTEAATSFLLDEDENISDLSSELSVDIVNYTDFTGKPMSPMLAAPGTAISGLEIPSHPLTHASIVNLSMHTSPNLAGGPESLEPPRSLQQSPLMIQSTTGEVMAADARKISDASTAEHMKPALAAGPAHVPFILACDSWTLAQQLTMVEQSALTEIEWTDLVEMRWTNSKCDSLDWAEYMTKHDDARGIDLVVTRFNLVKRWALSEIVLTQDIEERARVLAKLIHVAANARRLHNYATVLQLTYALTSTSCTRLKKTWELVPERDRSLLVNMEPLIHMKGNFAALRTEMEETDLSSGCIPFLGVYTRDLTYNAQKPAEILSEDSGEPLVNFERYRTAAIIIKGLLRLIDASLRYEFEPIHGIIERCLWISSLTDERIDTLSRSLE